MQCAPEAAKILSQYGAEKHQRNSISVLVELICALDSRLFSAGASRILVHALHATRLRPIYPRDGPFSVTVWLSWIFARLIGLTTVLVRGRHEDFGGSSSWSILNQLSWIFKRCHWFLSLFASAWLFISLMVHPSTLFWWRWNCAITIQASTEVEIVFNGLRTVLPLEPFLQSSLFRVPLKPETSWLYNSLNAFLLEER